MAPAKPGPQLEASARQALFGILDLAFLEEGAWVLVDFKTDKDPDALMAKYRQQLGLYADLLEKSTGLPVKEAHLLFLRDGKDVPVALTP